MKEKANEILKKKSFCDEITSELKLREDLGLDSLHMAVTSGSWCGGQRQRCGDSGSGLI